MPHNTSPLPEWEQVLSAAAHLQRIFPEAVLVGGTAAALYARLRVSTDADHVLTDLRVHFDEVLSELEAVAGWKTARVLRPVQILGSLDGIETGVRQLIRETPLETTEMQVGNDRITLPTPGEMLRIKAVLILKRNATRDYLDFCALAEHLGEGESLAALRRFDELYPQPSGESALQQLQIQLAEPLPFDLDEVDLAEYKHTAAQWQQWPQVRASCQRLSASVFDQLL